MNAIKANPRSAPARALAELGDGPGAQAEATLTRALAQSAADTRAVMAQALFLQGDAQGALRAARAADLPDASAVAAARWNWRPTARPTPHRRHHVAVAWRGRRTSGQSMRPRTGGARSARLR